MSYINGSLLIIGCSFADSFTIMLIKKKLLLSLSRMRLLMFPISMLLYLYVQGVNSLVCTSIPLGDVLDSSALE